MNVINDFFIKLQQIDSKKRLILIVVIGFTALFLIFISELDLEKNVEKEKEYSSNEYCEYLEDKTTEIIEAINGAGKTHVMITLSETTEYVYAVNDKKTEKNNDSSTDNAYENDYIIIEENSNDKGLLIKTIEPKIRGVAIVCEGGDNTNVQNQIYSTVSAVLDVNTSKISISKLTITEE